MSSPRLSVLVCKMGEELEGVKVSLKLPSDSMILRDLLKDKTKKDIDILQPYMSAVPVFSTGRGCQAPPTPSVSWAPCSAPCTLFSGCD